MISGCHNRKQFEPGYFVLVRKYMPSGEYHLEPEWIAHAMSTHCRQIGVLINDRWEELEDCAGCTAPRDWDYINTQRRAYASALQQK